MTKENNVVKIETNKITACIATINEEGRIYLVYKGKCVHTTLPLFLHSNKYKRRGVDIDVLIDRLKELKSILMSPG